MVEFVLWRRNGVRWACLVLFASLAGWAASARGDAVERLRLDRLLAVNSEVQRLRGEWQRVEPIFPYRDTRAVMHVHSHLSHDSRSPLAEIVAAARKLNIDVILFSEHPSPEYDYVRDGHRGVQDGVLLIPGAETGGFLAFPRQSLAGVAAAPPQEFVDRIREQQGQVFLSHLEERMDWDIARLTGTEIYNTHADVKDEANFVKMLKNPLGLITLGTAIRQFPQESFAAIQDYPLDYLTRYDQLTQHSMLCAIAANDAHHNQVYRLKLLENRRLALEDGVGKIVAQLPAADALLAPLLAGKKAGDVLAELDLDPYERTLNHVTTHLWLTEVTEDAVRHALESRRAYVAFDWMADPTSFGYWAEAGSERWPMGDELRWTADLQLRAAAPLAAEFRVIANGAEQHRETGRELTWRVPEPGVYRIEVWLSLAGEPRPWILANPIYVRAAN